MEQPQERKTDGQSGPPVPARPNSAMKETPKPGEGVDPNHPLAAHVVIVDREKAIVQGDRKHIAICGFASSSRGQVPVNSGEWEIWGLNQLYRHLPRADRWFDIHHNWNEEVVPGTDHRAWIRDCGIPVYMFQQHEELPTSVRYPLERVIEWGADYFTSTIAYMVALAIMEIDQKVNARVEAPPEGDFLAMEVSQGRNGRANLQALRKLYAEYTIGIFGVDLIVGEEYDWQKACAEFWIGAAALGRGIGVYLPPQSALCKQMYRYGFQAEPDGIIKLSDLDTHIKKLTAEREAAWRQVLALDGAAASAEQIKQLLQLRLRGGEIQF